MQQNGRPGVEGGEQFSIAQIISITKVRPSRGHATVTSKIRGCDVAKQNEKKESRQYTAYISSIPTRLVRVGRRKMSQTSEKNVSQLATKVRDTGNFGRAKRTTYLDPSIPSQKKV